MKKKIEEIFISECGCITWAYCDHRERKLLSLFDKTVGEVIGEDEIGYFSGKRLNDVGSYRPFHTTKLQREHNQIRKEQRLRYKEMRGGKKDVL